MRTTSPRSLFYKRAHAHKIDTISKFEYEIQIFLTAKFDMLCACVHFKKLRNKQPWLKLLYFLAHLRAEGSQSELL